MAGRLHKRITMDGVTVVAKNHGPPGGEPAEDVHGDRSGIGYGSKAALLSILTAARDGGAQVMSPDRLRDQPDSVVWDEAAKLYGSFQAVRAALDRLPQRRGGEALRAADVPAAVLPTESDRARERARLASLKAGPEPEPGKPDNRPPARFILHGVGSNGERYSVPVSSPTDLRSAGRTYLLAPGVESVGTVRHERI